MSTNHDSDEELVSEVLAAEQRRNRALKERDWETVEALLDDGLSYTHLSGRTETKAIYLAGVQNREHSVERSDLSVHMLGDVAIMTGGITFSVRDENGRMTPQEGVALQVWVKRDGSWRMAALQATRRTPPAS